MHHMFMLCDVRACPLGVIQRSEGGKYTGVFSLVPCHGK